MMLHKSVRHLFYRRRMFFHQLFRYCISFIIDEESAWFNFVYKNPKLFKIDLKTGENIDMVPGYTCEDGYMWKKKMEFWTFVNRTGRIFIAFTNNNGCICNIHRLFKSVQFCTDKIIERLS